MNIEIDVKTGLEVERPKLEAGTVLIHKASVGMNSNMTTIITHAEPNRDKYWTRTQDKPWTEEALLTAWDVKDEPEPAISSRFSDKQYNICTEYLDSLDDEFELGEYVEIIDTYFPWIPHNSVVLIVAKWLSGRETPIKKTPIEMEDIKQGTPMLVLNEYSGEWHSVKLKHVHSEDGDYRYHCVNGGAYKAVKFNPDEWIVWFGGEPPLPEGVEVEVIYRNGDPKTYPVSALNWKHLKDIAEQYLQPSNVIAYRVVGLLDGYCYPCK